MIKQLDARFFRISTVCKTFHFLVPKNFLNLNEMVFTHEMITKFGVLKSGLTEIYTAMLPFHTVLVTSAVAKRSFS